MIIVNKACIDLIKSFEGLFLKPYLCPAGVPTIGYGTIRYPNGTKVRITDAPITEQQANQYLMFEIDQKAKSIDPMLREDLTGNQFGALISFAYNLGEGALRSSTLLKIVNKEPLDAQIRSEFQKWIYADGKKLNGLLRRRNAEADLYFKA
jgi:lysozyme